MLSFYGGQNGQNFTIKAIFTSKNGPKDSLAHDLTLGWASPVGENELVMVSYGRPGDYSYNEFKQIDLDAEEKTYNSTLWLKCYDESDKTYNGWTYKMVASMTGNTPSFSVHNPVIELAPGELPAVDLNGDVDNPILVFSLPTSQVFSVEHPTTTIGPQEDPYVDHYYDETKDMPTKYPILRFHMPRAVRFYYGDKLGQRVDKTYELSDESFADYKAGDYYINEATGFIYLITEVKEDGRVVFEYMASIQAPLPKTSSVGISPYTDDKQVNKPTASRKYTDDNETTWEIEFGLPNAPMFDIAANFIGSTEKGSSSSEIKDKDTVKLTFNIPTGTRLFTGTIVDTGKYDAEVPGAKAGDVYLNSETGVLYTLSNTGLWVLAEGSGLKGPPGEPFHHVGGNYRIEVDSINDITLQAGVEYIKKNYTGEISNKDTFTITWEIDPGDGSEVIKQSYFYYCTDVESDQWNWALITGTFDIVKNEYHDGSPEDNVDIKVSTYSIAYINGLIGIGLDDVDLLDRKTYSADQIIKMLAWGTWDDAITGADLPVPENFNSLSAEEIIYLLSWGRFSKLVPKDEEEGSGS